MAAFFSLELPCGTRIVTSRPARRAGEGEALAVIAARRRNEARAPGLASAQRVDIGEPAAHLEGAGRQMVLVLDHDLGAEPLGEKRPADRRRRA